MTPIDNAPTTEPVEASQAPAEAPAKPIVYVSKLAVWFDFVKGQIKDSGRLIFTGSLNIRTQAELEAYESFIKTNGQFDRVQVTNWRMLEG